MAQKSRAILCPHCGRMIPELMEHYVGAGVEGYNWICMRPAREVNIFVSSGLRLAVDSRQPEAQGEAK